MNKYVVEDGHTIKEYKNLDLYNEYAMKEFSERLEVKFYGFSGSFETTKIKINKDNKTYPIKKWGVLASEANLYKAIESLVYDISKDIPKDYYEIAIRSEIKVIEEDEGIFKVSFRGAIVPSKVRDQ